jgi:choline dehydrogenase
MAFSLSRRDNEGKHVAPKASRPRKEPTVARIQPRRQFLKYAGASLATFTAACKSLVKSGTSSVENEPLRPGEYDYIVIGSGAGGGPLACNLARAGFKVLLLEAGQDRTGQYTYQIPGFIRGPPKTIRWLGTIT